ncbi:uncharacterized protein LOC124300677 isoform X1 [Neodiprion virginianus]|uniref:uncharacterized protein LOC124300677 isoform X1 n=2 Tax=Neodiprion virginianus TaxID=2961670 RepID=UPI001EE72CCF|nr:uncharacterized protein LOC124300677 isoform X1 [Neodiprion virginianus]
MASNHSETLCLGPVQSPRVHLECDISANDAKVSFALCECGDTFYTMRITRIAIFFLCAGLVSCEEDTEGDAAAALVEAARALFNDKETVGGLQGMASAFMQSGAGKQVNEMLAGGNGNGAGQILSGIGSLLAGAGGQGGGNPLVNSVLESFMQSGKGASRSRRESESEGNGGFDFETMVNIASMFMGDNPGANAEGIMGFLPMLLQNFGGDGSAGGSSGVKKHDHSGHSWFLPPILENAHIMWEHFSNSELGQTLWKNSGLANIVGTMTNQDGSLQYEKIFQSFENPSLRRRWVRSLTNYVADWISHVSDPATRQRYLTTVQYVGNGFLKSQGYPKSAMFDPAKPAESLSRLTDATAKRFLNMKIDSQKYVRPALAYVQELTSLASQKGFIVSHINANELSNKLSNTMNNDFIEPLLKVYRAYKWGTKRPECAAHILCVINEKDKEPSPTLRQGLTRFASYPAAWFLSNRIGQNFWTLYAAVSESERCFAKHPVDCSDFHEEEVRVTTEAIHSEL